MHNVCMLQIHPGSVYFSGVLVRRTVTFFILHSFVNLWLGSNDYIARNLRLASFRWVNRCNLIHFTLTFLQFFKKE